MCTSMALFQHSDQPIDLPMQLHSDPHVDSPIATYSADQLVRLAKSNRAIQKALPLLIIRQLNGLLFCRVIFQGRAF